MVTRLTMMEYLDIWLSSNQCWNHLIRKTTTNHTGINLAISNFDLVPSEEEHFRRLLETLDLDKRQKYNCYEWILTEKSGSKIQNGKITGLDLSWEGIHNLPKNFLKGLEHITSLRLDNNPHIVFEDGCFDSIPHLQGLKLQFCNLSEFPIHAFTSVSSIQDLDLSNNPINEMETGSFQKLLNIKSLEISRTGISDLQPFCFAGLGFLAQLSLKNNDLKTIPADTFQGLYSLEILDLCNNEIENLNENAFSGLNKLIELRLDNNNISMLPNTVFHQIPNIECISLANNKISSLNRNFSNLNYLTRLDLDTNLIDQVQQFNFSNSLNLKHILLQSNMIRSIDLSTFDDLNQLELFNIANNPLSGEQIFKLPSQAIFDYRPLIEELSEEEIYKYVVKYHKNTRFVDCVLQSERISDKTIAFLRLLGYNPNH
ncbi:MAG: leucine-rich repeat domain-containing protein [Candidatus Heimdallarchaeota archaeon]|nr:leucine-rich repeat domain-containing protein [Candidatus Heimdallarchaeota archaeon]